MTKVDPIFLLARSTFTRDDVEPGGTLSDVSSIAIGCVFRGALRDLSAPVLPMFSVTAASTVHPVVATAVRNASAKRVARSAPASVSTTPFRHVVSTQVRGARVKARAEEETSASKTATTNDDDEMPPWERREMEKKAAAEKGGLPWPAYLGLASIVGIASVGSCFELAYGNPIFGVVQSDSFAYKPILYWLIGTGFPLCAFLFVKGVQGANEAAELQDKLDGY